MKRLVLACVAAGALAAAAPAMAEVNFGISFGVPMMMAPPVVVAPQPMYYPPVAAPRYQYRYVAPRPVVEVPGVAYAPAWYGRHDWHEWREHRREWREHHDDDDDD